MEKNYSNSVLLGVALSLVCAVALVFSSCGEDEPDPKAATADFTFDVNPDESGSVAFTNTSTDGQEFSWDFGDGSAASTEESPTHVYAESGTYTVELTALGDNGTPPSKKEREVEVIRGEVVGPNLLVGGSFETADAASWTIVGTGADLLPKVEFGVTTNVPAGGSGGALRVSNPDEAFAGKTAEMVMYHSIALEAGKTYRISALIKHGPLTGTGVVDGGPKEAFFSLEISNIIPPGTGQWKVNPATFPSNATDDTFVLTHRYCVCWMGTTSPAANGPWLNAYTTSWINYLTGDAEVLDFSVPTSGTYYIGFKAGMDKKDGSSFGSDGFVVDNLQIREIS